MTTFCERDVVKLASVVAHIVWASERTEVNGEIEVSITRQYTQYAEHNPRIRMTVRRPDEKAPGFSIYVSEPSLRAVCLVLKAHGERILDQVSHESYLYHRQNFLDALESVGLVSHAA